MYPSKSPTSLIVEITVADIDLIEILRSSINTLFWEKHKYCRKHYHNPKRGKLINENVIKSGNHKVNNIK